MNWKLPAKELESIVKEAARFVSSRQSIVSLSGIHFLSEKGKITIRSGSEQVRYERTLSYQEEIAPFVVSAAHLLQAIRPSKEDVELSLEGPELVLKQGRSETRLPLVDCDVLEALPELGESWKLPREALQNALKDVAFAVSPDETKPVLTSLRLELQQPSRLVTTDGFRLALRMVDLSLAEPDLVILVPMRRLDELTSLWEKEVDPTINLRVLPEQGGVLWSWGQRTIWISQILGDFPNYSAILPEVASWKLQVGVEVLQSAVQQATTLSRSASGIIVFEVIENELVISTPPGNLIKGSFPLALELIDGDVPRFALNGKYILDVLSRTQGDRLELRGTEALRPIVVAEADREEWINVVMPFKLTQV